MIKFFIDTLKRYGIVKYAILTIILTFTLTSCGDPNSGGPEYFSDTMIISAGQSHTAAIKNDGTIWVWGKNYSGQLGNGESGYIEGTYNSKYSNIPVQLSAADGPDNIPYKDYKWKAVSVGSNHTVAIREDNTIWAWGDNKDGQLGDGSTTRRTNPVQLSAANGPDGIPYKDYKWKSVSAGWKHTVAIRDDNTIWAWGYNWYGQLGNGGSGQAGTKLTPTQLSTANGPDNIPYKDYKWKAVSAGLGHTVAIREDNTIWAWGCNEYGQLGDGNSSGMWASLIPVQLSAANGPDGIPYKDYKWKAVSAGANHTVAIREDNTIWAWGDNKDGQLGDGSTTRRTNPVQLSAANGPDGIPYKDYKWKSVSAGGVKETGGLLFSHTAAIREDNTIWVWGSNSFGQLGNNTIRRSSIPNRSWKDKWKAISAGDYHTAAIKDDGILYAWGRNEDGQLGDGSTEEIRLTPTKVIHGE